MNNDGHQHSVKSGREVRWGRVETAMAATAAAGARDVTRLELLVCCFFVYVFYYYTNVYFNLIYL
jgi:hypothetical protein